MSQERAQAEARELATSCKELVEGWLNDGHGGWMGEEGFGLALHTSARGDGQTVSPIAMVIVTAPIAAITKEELGKIAKGVKDVAVARMGAVLQPAEDR